jgi:pSer/pThr/pTyr-binding forkhead associated (FHA) protein
VIVEGELVIGREGNEISLDDPELSRTHAVIRLNRDALEIEDLGSLNGTWVNGTRIGSAVLLRPGDLVRLGQTTFEVSGGRPTRQGPELQPFVDTGQPASRRSPASRRLTVTLYCVAVIVGTAAALIVYFALR